MPKTLADYTPEERAGMVGMWCDVPGETYAPAVLAQFAETGAELLTVDMSGRMIFDPFGMEKVIPRFDLPRAWSPDGTPVEMDTQAETVGERGEYEEEYNFPDVPDGTLVRRFVTEWEVVE